jgi:hypothetical protein
MLEFFRPENWLLGRNDGQNTHRDLAEGGLHSVETWREEGLLKKLKIRKNWLSANWEGPSAFYKSFGKSKKYAI